MGAKGSASALQDQLRLGLSGFRVWYHARVLVQLVFFSLLAAPPVRAATIAASEISTRTAAADLSVDEASPGMIFAAGAPIRLDFRLTPLTGIAAEARLGLTLENARGRALAAYDWSRPRYAPGRTLDFKLRPVLRPGVYRADAQAEIGGRSAAELRFGFVVAPKSLRAKPDPPADFAAFWRRTERELAKVPLNPELEKTPAVSDARAECFHASYSSWGGTRVHAWYCRPKAPGRYPAVLISPWYGQGQIPPPIDWADQGVAALWYQGRGYGVDQSSYPVDNGYYSLLGIASPRTYVYRAMVCHGLRGLEFLRERPEVDAARLGVAGASQGGGLSLILAGLDPGVGAVAANFPFLSDIRDSLRSAARSPYMDIAGYLRGRPAAKAAALKTLSYFDVLNFAGRVRVPVFVETGLMDRTCPADGIIAMFNALASREKSLRAFPAADHVHEDAPRWSAMQSFLVKRL